MAAACPLPRTPDLPTLHAKLRDLLRFLRGALPISSAHTVDFYTDSVWRELVDLPPASVLAALRRSAAEAEPREALPAREAEAGSGEWRSARGGVVRPLVELGGGGRDSKGGVRGRGVNRGKPGARVGGVPFGCWCSSTP